MYVFLCSSSLQMYTEVKSALGFQKKIITPILVVRNIEVVAFFFSLLISNIYFVITYWIMWYRATDDTAIHSSLTLKRCCGFRTIFFVFGIVGYSPGTAGDSFVSRDSIDKHNKITSSEGKMKFGGKVEMKRVKARKTPQIQSIKSTIGGKLLSGWSENGRIKVSPRVRYCQNKITMKYWIFFFCYDFIQRSIIRIADYKNLFFYGVFFCAGINRRNAADFTLRYYWLFYFYKLKRPEVN